LIHTQKIAGALRCGKALKIEGGGVKIGNIKDLDVEGAIGYLRIHGIQKNQLNVQNETKGNLFLITHLKEKNYNENSIAIK
jgi:hypothetical protein